jgi:hypothetical protein
MAFTTAKCMGDGFWYIQMIKAASELYDESDTRPFSSMQIKTYDNRYACTCNRDNLLIES